MKRYSYLYIIGLSILSFNSGCKEDKYNLFDSDARIQFGFQNIPGVIDNEHADSLKFETFYYTPEVIKQDTVFFDVYTIGAVEKFDRPYHLRQIQVSGVDNAEAGKHYVGFDDTTLKNHYVIKADSVHARVPIIILRNSDLKNKTITLSFELVANDQFLLGDATKLKRRLVYTDRLSKPNAWTELYSEYFFGLYSVRKHAFMIESTGEKWDQNFISELSLDKINYYKIVLAIALIDYNNEHPDEPLHDEHGELIIFPN